MIVSNIEKKGAVPLYCSIQYMSIIQQHLLQCINKNNAVGLNVAKYVGATKSAVTQVIKMNHFFSLLSSIFASLQQTEMFVAL